MPVVRDNKKSATAFRTISEVADQLDVPQHVLRFWESKFTPLRPLKRRGGRRYYRPEDIILLRRIHSLLYTDGYTIKGVQRLLRDGHGKAPASPDNGITRDKQAVLKAVADFLLSRRGNRVCLADPEGRVFKTLGRRPAPLAMRRHRGAAPS